MSNRNPVSGLSSPPDAEKSAIEVAKEQADAILAEAKAAAAKILERAEAAVAGDPKDDPNKPDKLNFVVVQTVEGQAVRYRLPRATHLAGMEGKAKKYPHRYKVEK